MHEPLFVRSWIDTGYLTKLLDNCDVHIFVPSDADEIRELLKVKGIKFGLVDFPKSQWLHVLGRLQWAASTSLSSSLREQRRRVLFGYRAWPKTMNPWITAKAFVGFIGELVHFAQASPLGALLALFPPPKFLRSFFVTLSSSKRFSRHLVSGCKQVNVMLFPTTGFEPWMNTLLASLKSLDIKTILVPDNWDNLTSKNTVGVLPDAIVTIGDRVSKNLSTELGIPYSLLHGIGIPKFSAISVSKKATVRKPLKILFLGFSLPYDEISTLNGLFQLLSMRQSDSFTLYYKPHPNRKERSIQESQVLPGINVLSDQSKYVLPELDSSYDAFLHSFDVVIAPPTTMLLEFLLAGAATVIRDDTDDGVHRTTPKVFSRTWLHVKDIDSLNLPAGNGPKEIFSLVSKAIDDNASSKREVDVGSVISPNPALYADAMAELIRRLQSNDT